MFSTQWLKAISCGVLVAAAIGLGLIAGPASAQSPKTPIPIKLGMNAQPSWLLYTAKEKGYFEKAGLAPTYIKFVSGIYTISAVHSRSVDIVTPGITPFAAGLAQGVDWVAIGIDNESPASEGIVSRKGSNITKVEDLKGKTIGVARGSTAYYGLLYALNKKGIKKDDVKLLMLAPADQVSAMAKGDVDAISVWEPWIGRNIAENGARLVAMEEQSGVYTALSVLAAHRDYVKENPEAVRRYLKAMLMAYEDIQKNGPGIALDSMAALMAIPRSGAEAMWKQSGAPNIRRWADPDYLYSVSKNGKFAKNAQEMVDFLVEDKVLAKRVEVGPAFDDSFIRQVLAEGLK